MTASASPAFQAALAGQAAAAQPGACAWVSANAGSGKTKVLIDRVARLLLSGAEPASILCVTYTKAAASEMQARLFDRLGAWCVMPEDQLVAELSRLEGRQSAFARKEIERARELFAQALETPGGLRIETIHAFCGRLLRRFPLEAGISPGFRELDDEAAQSLWRDCVMRFGRRLPEEDQKIREASREVIGLTGGLTVIDRIHEKMGPIKAFLNQHADIDTAIDALRSTTGAPEMTYEDILRRTMTDELPRASVERIYATVTSLPTGKELATILGQTLAAPDASRALQAYRAIAVTADGKPRRKSLVTKAMAKDCPLAATLYDLATGEEIRRIEAALATLSARRLFDRSQAFLTLADRLLADYARQKRQRSALDFDDLIVTTARLLSSRENAQWVLWKLDSGLTHILLDEAQDTSPQQWEILSSLSDDIFAGAGGERDQRRTVFVVGDQKQSIYSFQGADPERFAHEGRRFLERAKAAQIAFSQPRMEMSFRSCPEVLDFVDAVFDPKHYAGASPFSTDPDSAAVREIHSAFRSGHSGSVEIWPLRPPAAETDPDPWDAPVDQPPSSAPKLLLAREIADFIAAEISSGSGVWDGETRRPCRPGDFLILVKRRTGGLFDAILRELKGARLPVAGADRISLLDSLPVQDILNLVRFVLCPGDDLALAEIIKGPFAGLDDDFLTALAPGRDGDLWSALRSFSDPRASPIRDLLVDLLDRRGSGAFDFLSHVMDRPIQGGDSGWERILKRFGDPAREPVTALLDRALGFPAGRPDSLQLFLEAIETGGGEIKRELAEGDGQIRIMTAHGAKGLQAPIVILPDTTSSPQTDSSGLLFSPDGVPLWVRTKDVASPLVNALQRQAAERSGKEHNRLLYVALTRAQDRLIICGAWTGRLMADGFQRDSWYDRCRRCAEDLHEAGTMREMEGGVLRMGGSDAALTREAPAASTPQSMPAWVTAPPSDEADPALVRLAPSRLSRRRPGDGHALLLGNCIHRLLQHLPSLPPADRRSASAAHLAAQPLLDDADRQRALAETFAVLESDALQEIFGPESRAEASIIAAAGDTAIVGRIDRLVLLPSCVIIVDFKTDRLNGAPARPSQGHLAQMGAYRRAARSIWPDRPVVCRLVFTDGVRIVDLANDAMDAALAYAEKTARTVQPLDF
jgi:ATP-dependent helicase/nuclease subunit A